MVKQLDDIKTGDLLEYEQVGKRGCITGIAKTTAQRQAAYRARRNILDPQGTPNDVRLNVWLSYESHACLTRSAKSRGITQRALLEILLANLERELVD